MIRNIHMQGAQNSCDDTLLPLGKSRRCLCILGSIYYKYAEFRSQVGLRSRASWCAWMVSAEAYISYNYTGNYGGPIYNYCMTVL